MSKTKSYNQIIFLTTLSVYLGLVLVGASPQVLAQAALTSKFEIKDQIEKQDDLDKKPSENDLFASEIKKLVNELNEFSEKNIFDWEVKSHYRVYDLGFFADFLESIPSYSTKQVGSVKKGLHKQVELAIDNNTFKTVECILKRKSKLGFNEYYSQSIDYVLSVENKTLEIKLSITNKSETIANLISDEFTTYLHQIISNQRLPKEKLVAENTTVTAENNQVFIVTRLPRAAIDSLIN